MNDATPRLPDRRPKDELDLRELVAVYLDNWLSIAVITVLCVTIAVVYIIAATPVFRTNALIQVEEKSSGLGALGELSAMLTGETPTEAEIEIVKSRAVLGSAIDQRGLEVVLEPVYFPIFGAAMARAHGDDGLAEPFAGFGSYAWGGEIARVDRLEVQRGYIGLELELVAGPGGSYSVNYDGRTLVEGRVGEPASRDGFQIFVSQLQARPGTRFRLTRASRLDALDDLRDALTVREVGKQTGILDLSLEGPSPADIEQTLNAIASTYLRQNVERTSEDAARTLEFLEEQLPELKEQLDAAEAALNSYRVRQGSIDLSLETQGLLEQVGEIEGQLSELELKQAELQQRYTSEHPVMQAISQQRTELDQIRAGMEDQIRKLPEAEQDSLRLMRDVRVANELYMLLLNRAQELKVVRAGTVGNVRIIDSAFRPVEPVKPNKPLLLLLAVALGGILGVFVVSLREAMNPTIRDPEDLEKIGGLPVYAIVPHSSQEESLNAKVGRKSESGQLLLAAKSDDVAIESLRSLRTSLEFLLLDVDRKLVTIGGPAPSAGKSFVTANLAALFGQAGKRALLVDADLRRGHLHRLFGAPRSPGLVEVVSDQVSLEEALRKNVAEGLDLLATGAIPPNPAELVTSPRFSRVLEELIGAWDVVLMDAPPVLGAAEAMTLARLSPINLLVVRSEQQTPREVELTLNKLRQAGAEPRGFVLNDLQVRARRHTYAGYHYYRYNKSS